MAGYELAFSDDDFTSISKGLNSSSTGSPDYAGLGKSILQRMLDWQSPDGTQHQGWGIPTLQALGSLGQGFVGFKQLGLMKDSLRENKRQFNMNWDAQRSMANSQMADRQDARIAASGPGVHMPTAEYLSRWGIN